MMNCYSVLRYIFVAKKNILKILKMKPNFITLTTINLL